MKREDAIRLAKHVQGTCLSVEQALETLEIDADADEAEEALEAQNYERCAGCGWWFESSELIDDDDNVVGCDQCRPQEQDA